MELLSQNCRLSTDNATEGFELSAGKIWIYPDNYPVREYQYTIVQTALYNNTLVCLPTGLGKTFIAAVVMYNYWRWYPKGKVIFLAPTRPLVMQQVDACYNVMGIPSSETEILLGTVNAKKREVVWSANETRVIFATPQVFHNDLEKDIAPANLIKCVVIDEAHKALGKHSYTECIRILSKKNKYFRVLALSATPGNKIDDVHEVVRNLHIATLEIRDENSPDIVPYTNQRQVKVLVVGLGSVLEKYKEKYIAIMDRHVKYLAKCNVLQCDTANITKGRIFHLSREIQSSTNKTGNHGQITKTLTILLTMYHAYELLIRNGLRAFHQFYQSHSDKFWIRDETQLQDMLDEIKEYLGPFPEFISPLASKQDIPENLNFGHKKFTQLEEILVNHFSSDSPEAKNSRAMIFVEYRNTVNEVYVLLLRLRPLIRAEMFVGQAGLKQKQQIQTLEHFRSNRINVLISTSIGEEGLDVGEVDLIICFDISQRSPTRLVQRMGRTGRKRDGQIIILVTDGKEHEVLKTTLNRRDSINNKILNTSNIFASLYEENPRMIPEQFTPKCHKMGINVEVHKPSEKSKKKQPRGRAKSKAQSNITESKSGKLKGQSSIAKFLVNKGADAIDLSPTSPSLSVQNQSNTNTNTMIDPSDIKLLTLDDFATDFLTLCTLKKSCKVEQKETDHILSKYTSTTTVRDNCFDFNVPDSSILDSLDPAIEELLEYTTKLKNDDPIEDVEDVHNNDIFSDDVDFSTLNDSFQKYVMDTDFGCTVLNSAIISPDTSIDQKKEESLSGITEYKERSDNISRIGTNASLNSNNAGCNMSTHSAHETSNWADVPSKFEALLDQSSDSSDESVVISITDDSDEHMEPLANNNANDDASCNNQPNGTKIVEGENNIVDLDDCIIVEDADDVVLNVSSGIETICDSNTKEMIPETENKVAADETDDSLASLDLDDISYSPWDSKPIKHNDTSSNSNVNVKSPDSKIAKGDKSFDNSNIVCSPPVTKVQINETGETSLWNITRALGEIERLNANPEEPMTYFDSDDDLFAEMDGVEVNDEFKYSSPKVIENHEEPENTNVESPPFIKKGVDGVDTSNKRKHSITEKSSFTIPKNESIAQIESIAENSAGEITANSVRNDNINNETTDGFDWINDNDWIEVAEKIEQKEVRKSSSSTPVTKTVNKSLSFSRVSLMRNTKKEDGKISLAKKVANIKRSTQSSLNEQLVDEGSSSDSDAIFNSITTTDADESGISQFFTAQTSFSRSTLNSPVTKAQKRKQLDSDCEFESDLRDDSTSNAPRKYFSRQGKMPTAKTGISNTKGIAFRDKKSSSNKENNGEATWHHKAKRRRVNQFICNEAEVSTDEANTSDESSGGDEDLADFVSHTQSFHDNSGMHAFYLQSIKSPQNRRHGFVFKKPRSPEPNVEIYSQALSQTHDSYLYDSFCVNGDEDEEETLTQPDYSILTEVEKKLANRSRNRSRKKNSASSTKAKKRKKIITTLNRSTSSDDETEELRRQVQNESLL